MTDVDFILDTNVLVYAFDRSDKRKHAIAEELLTEIIESDSALCVQNLAEFFYAVTKKVEDPVLKEQAFEILELLVNCKNVKKLAYDEKDVLDAATCSNSHFWDSLIRTVMFKNNIFKIYTENTKDFKNAGVIAVNPFKEKRK